MLLVGENMVFQINGNDYTKCLQDESYNVVQVDIGDSWTDANYKKHQNSVLKVQGSFSMVFITDDDYDDFLADVEAAKNTDGYVVCTLFVLNLNTTRQIECFLTISSNRYRPVNQTNVVHIINVQINEA